MRNRLIAIMSVLLLGAGTVLTAGADESSIHVQCKQAEGTAIHVPGDPAIRCDHLVAGDGFVSMANDNTDGFLEGKGQYIFGFARVPLPAAVGYSDPPAEHSPGLPVSLAEYPSWVMEQGMLAANSPGPTIVVDEDDELFLNLTNVGMMLRPDLFDPHTVHWHGFPQAASLFDGVPDASISINMGATLTYYYQAKDPGTYMYHCHVEATEHMQMGMLANLYVRPKQNRLPNNYCLSTGVIDDPACPADKIHHNPDYNPALPAGFDDPLDGDKYAYNDGDGSTRYDVEYPIQIGSFDPNFHDASYNVQPLPFAGMRDTFFLLNGRGYPDTVDNNVISTTEPITGMTHPSQPIHSRITANPGQRILLRISNLNVTRFNTLATYGIPMEVVGLDARLLRDDAGNNLSYKTNSVTLGGGQSADVILDTTGLTAGSIYFLYTTNLESLANDAENFGGMMTEIRITSAL